jgi:hypothetical protein
MVQGRVCVQRYRVLLDAEGLELFDCRRQEYDSGANEVCVNEGVQANILRENPKVFFMNFGELTI